MSEKKIIVPEAMRKAFGRGTQDLDPEGYLAFHGLEQVVLWLNDILHPANADFHRAILKREQERYPDEVINGAISGSVISYRVAFEYGASFARNYIRDLFGRARGKNVLLRIFGEWTKHLLLRVYGKGKGCAGAESANIYTASVWGANRTRRRDMGSPHHREWFSGHDTSRFKGESLSIERAIATPGWMSAQELAFLAFTAQKSCSIAEIGSWRGRSARAMSDNTPGALYCVDTWADNAYGAVFPGDALDLCQHKDWLWNEFHKNLADRIGVNVFPGRMNSIEGAQMFAAEPKTFDCIFIDAGHNEADVVQDIEAWRPLLREGGVLCGHDYHEHHLGVRLAVDRLIPKFHVIDSIWVAE